MIVDFGGRARLRGLVTAQDRKRRYRVAVQAAAVTIVIGPAGTPLQEAFRAALVAAGELPLHSGSGGEETATYNRWIARQEGGSGR